MRSVIFLSLMAFSLPIEVASSTIKAEIRQHPAEQKIVDRIRKVNKNADAERIASAVIEASTHYDIDPLLIASMIEEESTFRANAVGEAGERGLMQLMRGTAKRVGLPWKNAFGIEENVWAGVKYLSIHVATMPTIASAVARYNGSGPPAKAYAKRVEKRYQVAYR